MYKQRPYAFTNKYLFPPVLPNSVPAFIGTDDYKIFFKKSVANFANIVNNQPGYDKFNQIHVSIHALENNRNAINTDIHKTGFICMPLAKDSLDEGFIKVEPGYVYRVYGKDPKTPYCAVLKGLGDTFSEVDKLYKVQVRLGNWTNADGSTRIPRDLKEMREMETDNSTTSEWSAVAMIKPISEPDFGVHKFLTESEMLDKPVEERYNEIGTANFEYIGYYNTIYDSFTDEGYKTFSGDERLVEYRFRLYDSGGTKLLSDSGPINLVEHERKNISYSFNYLTQDQERYYIDFSIKTENGFEQTKRYPIKANYIVLEMSNAMVRVKEERAYARMKLEIQAKQVVLEPNIKPGTSEELSKLEFVKDIDDPMYSGLDEYEQEKIKSTHAMIEGVASASKSFYLVCPKDIWVMETKIAGFTPFNSREEALAKPYILLENEYLGEENIPYLTKVKFITYKKVIPGLGVTTDIIEDPVTGIKSLRKVDNSKTVYIFEAVKASYKRQRGEDILIAEQTVKKESVNREQYVWEENLPIAAEKKDRLPVELKMDSRWQRKEVPVLDIIYPVKDGRMLTPLEADPEVKEISKPVYILNDPKPIDPCQEYYLFITSYAGGLGMEVIESKKYKTKPGTIETLEEDYVINNPILAEFLKTKKIPENKEE